MNELLKLLSWINQKAFEKAKRLEYALGAYIYNKKTEAIIEKYSIYEKVGKIKLVKEDIKPKINLDEVPVIDFEDYPTEVELNRYLRANFGDTYPKNIEVHYKSMPDILVLDLEAITNDIIHKDFFISLSNSKGEFYAYSQHRLRVMN